MIIVAGPGSHLHHRAMTCDSDSRVRRRRFRVEPPRPSRRPNGAPPGSESAAVRRRSPSDSAGAPAGRHWQADAGHRRLPQTSRSRQSRRLRRLRPADGATDSDGPACCRRPAPGSIAALGAAAPAPRCRAGPRAACQLEWRPWGASGRARAHGRRGADSRASDPRHRRLGTIRVRLGCPARRRQKMAPPGPANLPGNIAGPGPGQAGPGRLGSESKSAPTEGAALR